MDFFFLLMEYPATCYAAMKTNFNNFNTMMIFVYTGKPKFKHFQKIPLREKTKVIREQMKTITGVQTMQK